MRPSTRLATLEGRGTDHHGQAPCRRHVPKLMHLLRGDLDWIVMKCLEKDRTRRYETANGLAMDLKRHLNNEPVVARPPSTAYRFQKAWRRQSSWRLRRRQRWSPCVGGWAVTVSTWQAIAASRARSAEQQQRLAAPNERDKAQAARASGEAGAPPSGRGESRSQRTCSTRPNMNLAQQAWEQNNIGRLRQLLEDTQDSPYRGFEWYYWQPQTHLALKTLRGHLDGGDICGLFPGRPADCHRQ